MILGGFQYTWKRKIFEQIRVKMDRDTDQQHQHADQLKTVVFAAERKVVLRSKDELDGEDGDEGDIDAVDDNLRGHAKDKFWHDGEQRVVGRGR